MQVKFKPHNYQKKAIKFMLQNPAAALLLEPGLGKTVSVLSALDILKEQGIVKKTLVVSTIRIIYSVWPKEIKKWSFDFSTSIVHGDHKLKALKADADIYLINFDGLLWLQNQPKKLLEKFDVLVLDESSKVKNFKTLRFKAVKKLLNYFDRRYILTGTPTPKSLMDLFSQIYVLDQGEALGRYITAYRNEFFYPYGFKGYQYALQDGADKKIYKKIKPLVVRFDESFLNLPKKTDNFIEIELPDDVMSRYREMEEEFVMELKEGHVLASTAAVKTQKLRQIVNGHIKDNYGDTHFIHEAKIEALSDLIEELQGSPLLVGYEFKADLKMLMDAFPYITVGGQRIKSRYVGGGVKPKDALKIEDEWNAGKLPLLFGQISSVAHGLNLQDAGHHAAFYSLTWNLEDYLQLIKRIWRQGQKKQVIIHHLMVKDSVDYDVKAVLDEKNMTQTALLNALKTRLKR
jgi:SNF2 family DNA or RNA helicase